MTKLSKDFMLIRYGLKVRLVKEGDAEFILSLRADPDRTKYMITLDDEISLQEEWIREYKEREGEGLDYYFIYSDMIERPIGVNRISKIDSEKKTAKISSWVVVKGLKYEAIKMLVILNEIAFELIGIEKLHGEVHIKNRKAIKIFDLLNYKFKDLRKDFHYITLSENDFYKSLDVNKIDKFKSR